MRAIPYLPDEETCLKLRKHWLILLRDTSTTILGGILPVVVLGGLSMSGYLPSELAPFMPFLTFLLSLWMLVTWLSLCVMWTDYYLDIWIVTNRRIINIEQVDLFNRRVTSWNISDVREVHIHVENVVQTFFDYGSIEIETAGSGSDEYERIEGIPHPERVRTEILKHSPVATEALPLSPVSASASERAAV